MRYFVVANSFAAPFVSDESTNFQEGDSPESALEAYAAAYSHPAGLYSAVIYADANAYHERADPLARWLSNHAQAKQRATAGKGSYSYLGHGPGRMEIDGAEVKIENPKAGSIVRR